MRKAFVLGRVAKSWDKFNIDWLPTLLLGHKKVTDQADHKEAAVKQSKGARKRELVKKPAKRQKLNDPGQQVSDLSFEGNEGKEKKQQHLKLAYIT